jgi:hypothetical protein
MLGYRALYAGLLFATTSFVWFYAHPLAADMPLHIALAKVYADSLTSAASVDSPYQPYLAISSYALPELFLVPLILLFGIDIAWKIALSLYGFSFPLSISFLVGKINPASRWTRLVGFPITLGYFFHWGFWPFLAGLVLGVVATAVSLGERVSAKPSPMEIGARFLTFLCHPIPAFCVGLFDTVRLCHDYTSSSEDRYPKLSRAAGYLILLWLPAILMSLLMLGNHVDDGDGGFQWVSLPSQAVQLLRPFYLTREWYEFAVPLVFAAILTYRLYRLDSSRRSFVPAAGILCLLVGLLMPRQKFIGSWENGARVILYGFILIAASWSWVERQSKALILGWVLSGSAVNLAGSHALWSIHEPSFAWAMDTLNREFAGYRIIEEGTWTGEFGIALGNNLPTWAWCKGIAADAKNVAGIRKTGPAIYTGLGIDKRASFKTVFLHYHPYRRPPDLYKQNPNHRIYFDSMEIYSLEERFRSSQVSEAP